ncbi:MAG: hypothetical protein WAS27_02070 [Candidatus Saccharimonadales bacterium]
MQPENQPSAPAVPPTPQPAAQPSQPVQSPVQQPPGLQPQSHPVAPASAATPPSHEVVQDALGAVAVAEQVEDYDNQLQEADEYAPTDIDLSQPVSWEAREYIHQEKGKTWFIYFAGVFVVLMLTAVFLMQSWSFAILLVVIAAVIIVLAKRPPRLMEYTLSEDGLHIDETLHHYIDFKSFGVIRDGEEFSVMLIPRKRFQPGITVYFPEEIGEDVVDVLGSRLPMRDLHLDAVDRLVRKLRL